MRSLTEISAALNAIREALDLDVIGCDIESVNGKLLKLTQLTGLSAETKASAKKLLGGKELEVLREISPSLSPSIQVRMLNAECSDYNAILEYSDRLNAALTHSMEALRTVISLYKTELQNGLITAKQN